MSRNKGFSLVELLTTTAIISVLATIAIAVFDEYKLSAYYISAHASCRNLQTAIESSKVEDSNNNLLSTARTVTVYADNSKACSDSCTPDSYLDGFTYTPDVTARVATIPDDTYSVSCFHCKNIDSSGTSATGATAVGISGLNKSSVSVSSTEADKCGQRQIPTPTPTATATATATPTATPTPPTSTPTATPTPTPAAGCGYCNTSGCEAYDSGSGCTSYYCYEPPSDPTSGFENFIHCCDSLWSGCGGDEGSTCITLTANCLKHTYGTPFPSPSPSGTP